MIPQLRRDTVVSVCKPVMVEVMFQQGSRENSWIVMGAIMDKQVPGVGDEGSGQNDASRGQVKDTEAQPHLPENLVYSRLGTRVMNPVLYWSDRMQHKAMSKVFNQRKYHETATDQTNNDG